MENCDIKRKIKNLQSAIVQRAIIKDAYIVNDAKNYIDLIYKYCFQSNSKEEIEEWFKIKDVILLSNLHYIKNLRDAYIYNNDISNIDYKKILNVLNEYQKYMKKNNINYGIPYFDFENEIKIKEEFQTNHETNNEKDENNIYYYSSYSPNGKVLKLAKSDYNEKNKNLSIFAVIHNLLIRTKMIPKTDYLTQKNLNEQELNSVFYLQIIILNAIRNGTFLVNHKNKIAVNKANIENAKIACDNLNYYINLFNHLMKETTEEIKCTIVENNEKGININGENIVYEIINEELQLNNKQPIWTANRIEYSFSQENKIHYEKLLYEIFKFKEFRKGQLEIISNIMQSTNEQVNVGILPTGHGKSLIYQFMGILQPMKTIILSPTEILLYDQITNLHESEFDLVSVLDKEKTTEESIINYSTTETFLHEKMLNYLEILDKNNEIFNIVLDECHYVSLWGHSFNPAYLALSKAIVEKIKNAQITMFTATASNVVLRDIKLQFKEKEIKIMSPVSLKRGDIQYNIIKGDNIDSLIENIIKVFENSYETNSLCDCSTKIEPNLSLIINNDPKILKEMYKEFYKNEKIKDHVILWDNTRRTYEMFRNGIKTILLANDDFVVGLNIPNLKNIICLGIPPSKEWLYQEGGRVGRNGEESNIIIGYMKRKEQVIDNIFDLNIPVNEILGTIKNTNEYIDIANKNYILNYLKDEEEELKAFSTLYNAICKNISGELDSSKVIISLDTKAKKEYNFVIYILFLISFIDIWLYTDSKSTIKRDYITTYKLLCKNLHYYDLNDYIAKAIQKILEINMRDNDTLIEQINQANDMEDIVRGMIKWIHENILFQKRQMLINTYQLLEEFDGDCNALEENLATHFNIKIFNPGLDNIRNGESVSSKNKEIVTPKLADNTDDRRKIINRIAQKKEKAKEDSIIDKAYLLQEMDATAWSIVDDIEELENSEMMKAKCEKLIEETYSFGLLLILAILEMQKNGSKMIRFKTLAQNLNEKDLIKLYIAEKENMTKRNIKRAKRIMKEVYPAKGLIRRIKYMFL